MLLAMLVPASAWAQGIRAQGITVIQAENVRFDYAQVLRVEPVYQVLRATRMEERCDVETTASESEPGKLSKIVGAVTGAVKGAVGKKPAAASNSEDANCRTVPVEREFRRPIAFDVDYVYRGSKYRSRLPMDPGNRLRVKVSLTPVVPAVDPR
ncbi:MAG: hypothetical protein LH470_01300 [Lysobacter sp.]|nr:hypothetical protein [Lysobacter sp.]